MTDSDHIKVIHDRVVVLHETLVVKPTSIPRGYGIAVGVMVGILIPSFLFIFGVIPSGDAASYIAIALSTLGGFGGIVVETYDTDLPSWHKLTPSGVVCLALLLSGLGVGLKTSISEDAEKQHRREKLLGQLQEVSDKTEALNKKLAQLDEHLNGVNGSLEQLRLASEGMQSELGHVPSLDDIGRQFDAAVPKLAVQLQPNVPDARDVADAMSLGEQFPTAASIATAVAQANTLDIKGVPAELVSAIAGRVNIAPRDIVNGASERIADRTSVNPAAVEAAVASRIADTVKPGREAIEEGAARLIATNGAVEKANIENKAADAIARNGQVDKTAIETGAATRIATGAALDKNSIQHEAVEVLTSDAKVSGKDIESSAAKSIAEAGAVDKEKVQDLAAKMIAGK